MTAASYIKADGEYVAVSNGDADMAFITCNWYASNGMPWAGMYDTAFLYKNPEHYAAVFDPNSETGKYVTDRVLKESNNKIRIVGAIFSGTRTLWLRKASMVINKPEDMASIKLRVSTSAPSLLMGKALGAQPTSLDSNEVYLALQTGTIDAQENTLPSSYSRGMGEVCEAISLTKHGQGGQTIAMTNDTYNKMTDEQKALFDELIAEAVKLNNKKVEESEAKIFKDLEDNGMVMQTPDVDAFKAYAQQVYKNAPVAKEWPLEQMDKINAMASNY